MITVVGEALIDLVVGHDGRIDAQPDGGPFNTARAAGLTGPKAAASGRRRATGFGHTRVPPEADAVAPGLPELTGARGHPRRGRAGRPGRTVADTTRPGRRRQTAALEHPPVDRCGTRRGSHGPRRRRAPRPLAIGTAATSIERLFPAACGVRPGNRW